MACCVEALFRYLTGVIEESYEIAVVDLTEGFKPRIARIGSVSATW